MNLLTTIYQGTFKPLNDGKFINNLNLINEFIISSCAYIAVICSGMASDEEQVYQFGWVIIITLSAFFFSNMTIVAAILIRRIIIVSKLVVIYAKKLPQKISNNKYLKQIKAKIYEKVEQEEAQNEMKPSEINEINKLT